MKTIIINESSLEKLKPFSKKAGKVDKVNSGLMMYEDATDDEFKIGFEPGGDGYGHILGEMEEDVNPEDVDLSSFELQDRLHPKFWKDGRLDSRVRLKLLDIADDFMDFMGTDWVEPDDIIMTGSLANYNWSEEFSDIDLHIVMDYSKIDENGKMVERFLRAQTMLWGKEHEDLNICGFPVEIYVQNTGDELMAGGVYSLERDEWIKEPEREDLTDEHLNRKWIQKRVAKYMDKIDSLVGRYDHAKDEYQLERINLACEKLFGKIKDERKEGFEKDGGEMNNRNIVFKTLRRQGYLQKIKDIEKNVYNILNSL